MIKSQDYYVDKTEILYELVENTDNEVTLFTRPRRFGKTLTMSMIENFFNVRKDSRELFEGLDIFNYEDFCEKWMNKYPVIFISFKDAEADEFDTAYDKLKNNIADLCKSFSDVIDIHAVNPADAKIFNRLMYNEATDAEIQSSLKIIMRILSYVYKKKVILLIDEYDVPLSRASEIKDEKKKYYRKMLGVIRGIMSSALKDNEFLEFAVITGCLRVAKESIFTGANNFASYSVLDNRFSKYFGFLEEEVREMLEAAGRAEALGVIREWYNGYYFGNSHIYCPWDTISYISDLSYDADSKPKNYWKNTSHNGILLAFVKNKHFSVKSKFETLMGGGSIFQNVSDDLAYDTLHLSEDNLWSVLLMAGYITKADSKAAREATVSLKIPNKEIATIFEETVVKMFRDTIDKGFQENMMDAMWNIKESEAGEIISKLLMKTISYNDYQENYYHAFLAGIFTGLGYEVQSNMENGLGRPDIVLRDDDNYRVLVVETKRSDKKENMEKDCKKALDQINDKMYTENFDNYRQVICCGIAFFKKSATVKLEYFQI